MLERFYRSDRDDNAIPNDAPEVGE